MRSIKKCLSVLLALTLLLSTAVPAAFGAEASYYGDLDGNGKVNSTDARIALRAAAKLDSLSDSQKKTGDMNGDGKINSTDARTILRMAAKIEALVPFAADAQEDKTWSSAEAAPVPAYEPAVFKAKAASLDLGYIDLGGDFSLVISAVEETEYSEEMDAYYKTYNISLGDIHQLNGVAEIRVPYSAEHVEAGQDPAKCVAAMYKNPETGEWEPVLYDVDAEKQEVVIYTDHFSTFGCFTFKNESKRMAKAITVSDLGTADVAAAVAAMQEYMDNGGQAGEKCRDLARPYAETFLNQLKERANATADKMTNWSNIANLLMATVPGLEKGVNKYLTTQALWQDFGFAGIACAAVSLAIQMTNDEKTPADVANMYKDAMYLLISVSQDSLLGTIGSAVWVVDRALTEMNTYGWNKVKDDLKMCYRWYMEKENRWHGKPRTMPQWRTIIRDISMKAESDGTDAAELIEQEIDNYCNEFWLKGDQYMWEIYDELGQTGRGLPSQQMRDEITAEFKGELLDKLKPVFNAVEKDLKNQLRLEFQKRLNKIVKDYNTVTKINLIDDNKNPAYAGYTAVFKVADNGITDARDWTVTLNADGVTTLKTTYLGYVLAGEPTEVELYGPKQKVGKDQPERTVKFVFAEPKTDIMLADAEGGIPGYYKGTYSETRHYDKDSVHQGNRGYYIYEYNGNYYLMQGINPTYAEEVIRGSGAERLFNAQYDNDRVFLQSYAYDPAAKTITFSEKTVYNDIQYHITDYMVTFADDGSVSVSWKTTSYFNDEPKDYESGTFTGQKTAVEQSD
ncbi:MAG: dockerin type I repeat-containing protein [Clostridia bacterium]|nr:dockerin type I repeat-containing protein [Clostridia bacterium]